MDCIGPVTPDEIDFLAYADDSASFLVREHFVACPACRMRAFEVGREQRTLQALLHRAGCPSSLALGQFRLGLAGEPQASEVDKHVAGCPTCQSELADLAGFMKALNQPLAKAAGKTLESLHTVVARLTLRPIAGLPGALAPALRGSDDDITRAPLVYEADDILVTVDSWIERPGQPGRAVAGLVVGPASLAGAEASLDPVENGHSAPVDELGNFLFSDVAPGVYHLVIRLPRTGMEIEINELTVK